jgi:hypothetical protein
MRILACLSTVLYSLGSSAQETDPDAITSRISSGIPEIAWRAKGKVEDFRLLAEGSRVDLQAEMTISVDETPAVLTWALECIEPGPNRIGEEKRRLASQASDVSQDGRFRLSASVTRKEFLDCYAYGEGPDLSIRWQEDGNYVTKRHTHFGELIQLFVANQVDGVRVQGFSDSDFKKLKRWRKINVFLDREVSDAWPLVADDLGLVVLETRKTLSSGEEYRSEVEFAVDDPNLKILFAYLDEKGPQFSSYEYRVSWRRAGGVVYRESDRWKQGDWGALTISWPLDVIRVDIEADPELAYAEVVVEVSCDQFNERKSTIAEITSMSDVLTELNIGCDKNTAVSYQVTATSRDGETMQTDIKPLEDTYIYVRDKTFVQE